MVGSLPFDARELGSKGMVEMRHIIREVEPPNPQYQARYSAQHSPPLPARREVEPARLRIILPRRIGLDRHEACLEKDRKRRYRSVGELSDDIQRYLDDEQVPARPATKIYRLKKFVRRNKSSVFAASLVLLALLAGLGLATIGFFRDDVERQRAVSALVKAEEAACVGG